MKFISLASICLLTASMSSFASTGPKVKLLSVDETNFLNFPGIDDCDNGGAFIKSENGDWTKVPSFGPILPDEDNVFNFPDGMSFSAADLEKAFQNSGTSITPQSSQERDLFKACELDNENIVSSLIAAGVNVNCRNHTNDTPLAIAANNSSTKALNCIINAGADLKEVAGLLFKLRNDDAVFKLLAQAKRDAHSCSTCDKLTKIAKACSRCKKAFYCNKACQAKAWPNHKVICNK